MIAQLSPTPVQKFFDNNGSPLFNGTLTTYVAGTTTPQATYVDSTQTTQNTNPITLNFRGECNLWLDPTLSYKFVLKDSFGNTIWTVDNIQGGFTPASIIQSLIPIPTNTWTLGNSTHSWAQAYLGPNAVPVYQTTGNIVGYIGQTSAETSAGVTPTNYAYSPLNVLRYGADSTGVSDSSTAINNAIKVANYGGGGTVSIPAGTYKIASTINFLTTPNLGQVVIQGAGKVGTTLNYTGLAAAVGVGAASTRIFDCGVKDMTIVNSGGTGTVGLDMDSVSTSHFEHVTITNFPTAARLHSTINGGAVYTRWYDVTAQMSGSPTAGFSVDAVGSNAAHFIACRYNGPGNTVGTAWKIVDAIGTTVTDCDIDQCLVAFALTAPSGAGFCDYNIIKGNRIEFCGTVYSIGANVRFTKIFGNAYQSNTTFISDSGIFNDVWDPPANCVEYIAGSGLTAYNTGSRSLVNKADPGGAFPFVLVDDTVSSTAGASGMNLLKSASNGMYIQGYLSGTLKFQVSAPGGVGFYGASAPTARPNVTGSKGANAALTSLMTALAACGIVTDSTT